MISYYITNEHNSVHLHRCDFRFKEENLSNIRKSLVAGFTKKYKIDEIG